MLSEKSKEQFSTILSNLENLPHFHDADLFDRDIVDIVGVQIHCQKIHDRIVYSVKPIHESIFKKLYRDQYSLEINNKIIIGETYKSVGCDGLNDISPKAIVDIISSAEKKYEEETQDNSILTSFILLICLSVEKWNKYISQMSKKIESLHQICQNLHENTLKNDEQH
jgi:hypothetical protein